MKWTLTQFSPLKILDAGIADKVWEI